jgi:hypothetical protein
MCTYGKSRIYAWSEKERQVIPISVNKSPTETKLNKTDHSTGRKIKMKVVYVGGLVNVEQTGHERVQSDTLDHEVRAFETFCLSF